MNRPSSYVGLSLLLGSILASGVLSGCYNVPVTGRKAVSMVDQTEITKKSIEEFEQMKKMQRISRNPAQIRIVNQIGSRLSRTVFWDVPLADWEFVVFDAPSVLNAFAMPGGKVAVFSGLIDFCQNEDQLASVIAHEIAHVAAHHTDERFSQSMLLAPVSLAGAAVSVGASVGGTSVYIPSVGSAASSGLAGVTQLAFDRGKELEADHIGLMYMARAGYNPREAVTLLQRMEEYTAAQGVKTPPAWLTNHPDFPDRQARLLDLMPEALKLYETGGEKAKHTVIE